MDVELGLVPALMAMPTNAADVTEIAHLLHGRERSVRADTGYTGAEQRVPAQRGRRWHIAAKRGRIKALPDGAYRTATQQVECIKAAVRARVEHPFCMLKRQFGYITPRFKGQARITAQLQALLALVKL